MIDPHHTLAQDINTSNPIHYEYFYCGVPSPRTSGKRPDVDQLIAEATKFSTNFQPWVVFISSTDLNKKFGHHLIHPVYCCKSMHDFLKIGLDRHGCVIVVDENRAECSTLHLRELLISRTTQPFEIIPYSQTNEHQLLNEIKNSCQRVMHLISWKEQSVIPPKR